MAESEMKINYFEKLIPDRYRKDLCLNLQTAQMLFDVTISRGKVFFFTLKPQPYMSGIIWQNITVFYICSQCICKPMVRSYWQSRRYFKCVLYF